MKPSDYNIVDLIPQRPPMVMIDNLVYAGERSAGGRLYVKDSNLFLQNGFLLEAGMVEFIAQTAAAYTGFLQLMAGMEVRLGFIGSVKNLVVNELPVVNSIIESEIIIESELLGYKIITGRVKQKGKVLAECEMRIKLENN